MALVATMERRIVRAVVNAAIDKGYSVTHFDGEQTTAKASPCDGELGVNDLIDEIRVADEEMLIIWTGKNIVGKIWLVYGNDGYDVIADHSNSVSDLIDEGPVKELIDQYESDIFSR